MIEIPVSWVSFAEDNPARGRWDQLWLDRMLAGEEWFPPAGFRFVSKPWNPRDGVGRVAVFPAGYYGEHNQEWSTIQRLRETFDHLPWLVLIATSDECQTFPWNEIELPDHVKLWVQLPRVEHHYPPRTRFYGEGSPSSPKLFDPTVEKDIDVFFSGQAGHIRREDAFANMSRINSTSPKLNVVVKRTPGFIEGMSPEEYRAHLSRSWFAPAPSGICSQSSFRFFEALEAQAIPIADGLRPDLEGEGYWRLCDLDGIAPIVDDWRELPALIQSQHPKRVEIAGHVQSRWQQYKRRTVHHLHNDVFQLVAPTVRRDAADDNITVVVPTSPVPSNPDLSHIQETIDSIRQRLPRAEILITCDGVRDEQRHRADAYHEFVRRLCAWTNTQFNVCPFTFTDHQHQSGMMRSVLAEVSTPWVLYVEHDCPLVGDLDFERVLRTMEMDEIASMRFHHDVFIHPTSAHLYLEIEGNPDRPYLRTVQWSQRPHLASTAWYRDIMGGFFGWDSRTMIEDVMHSVVQHAHTGNRAAVRAGWKKWRMAVWAPDENIKHSGHLDARGDDPKYPMLIAYDNDRPDGGPPEGWR